MDFQKLFLSADGRIGRGEFWAGWCILFVVNLVLHFIPVIGWLAGLALIYCWVCVYSKRLHDMGKSGWLQLIPYGVFIAAIVIGFATGAGAVLTAMVSHQSDDAAGAMALGGLGMMGLMFLVACLVSLIFLLWVGISGTQPGDNRYGPEPGTAPALPPTTPAV